MLRAGEEGSRPLIWLVSLTPVLYAHSLGFPCIVRSAHSSGVTGYLKDGQQMGIRKLLSEAIYRYQRQERPTLAIAGRGGNSSDRVMYKIMARQFFIHMYLSFLFSVAIFFSH